jgi:hypothetical protein
MIGRIRSLTLAAPNRDRLLAETYGAATVREGAWPNFSTSS